MTAAVMPQAKKAAITPQAALISTIRTWFAYRDEALWAFVGGTEAAKPLEEIEIGETAEASIGETNAACRRAWKIAEKIAEESDQRAATVMREAINELLAAESPRFLLSLPHIAGSF